MLAAAGGPGQQVWFWAARQAIAPAGIPSGVGVMRLQLTRLGCWVAAPSAWSVYPFVYTSESHGCHPFTPVPAPLG
jgi:hypothetical protein